MHGLLLGSCHLILILFITSTNYFQIVRRQYCPPRHHQQLTSRLRKVVGVDQVVREHRHGQHLYRCAPPHNENSSSTLLLCRNVSHLTIACMNNKTDEVAALIERWLLCHKLSTLKCLCGVREIRTTKLENLYQTNYLKEYVMSNKAIKCKTLTRQKKSRLK